MDTQATLPGHVIPSYVLESWHDNERYETELDRIIKKKVPTNEPIEFTLNRTTLVPPYAQVPRFEATSLGIGRQVASHSRKCFIL